ncbi:MAG TPA: hypothetical protein VIG30_00775 [Ktedonobacterales bacterium]
MRSPPAPLPPSATRGDLRLPAVHSTTHPAMHPATHPATRAARPYS